MQTTLRIDDKLYRQAKAAAAGSGVTITRYIEDALKLSLRFAPGPSATPALLPTFKGGGFPFSPEQLKQLARSSESAADRRKLARPSKR